MFQGTLCMKIKNISHSCGTFAFPDSLSILYPALCWEADPVHYSRGQKPSGFWLGLANGKHRLGTWFYSYHSLPAGSPWLGCLPLMQATAPVWQLSPYALSSFWCALLLHQAWGGWPLPSTPSHQAVHHLLLLFWSPPLNFANSAFLGSK